MSTLKSPTTGRVYGGQRVCQVFRWARSLLYAQEKQDAMGESPKAKRGPKLSRTVSQCGNWHSQGARLYVFLFSVYDLHSVVQLKKYLVTVVLPSNIKRTLPFLLKTDMIFSSLRPKHFYPVPFVRKSKRICLALLLWFKYILLEGIR